uniref:Uncharacterized protein n=1 Tax=Knipowitschia caucasica TaxID=637954 RepID=A0AAV2LJS1_KNICA
MCSPHNVYNITTSHSPTPQNSLPPTLELLSSPTLKELFSALPCITSSGHSQTSPPHLRNFTSSPLPSGTLVPPHLRNSLPHPPHLRNTVFHSPLRTSQELSPHHLRTLTPPSPLNSLHPFSTLTSGTLYSPSLLNNSHPLIHQ